MWFHFIFLFLPALLLLAPVEVAGAQQTSNSSSTGSSSSSARVHRSTPRADSRLDAGTVSNGSYRNASFGFTCKIPDAWVLRTEEMNQNDDNKYPADKKTAGSGCAHTESCVLLAAFSRPPLAKGPDVNSSILIAAESASNYPGLKEAAQYFGPVTEIAKAQGFDVAEEPYEFAVGAKVMGAKVIVRGDFQKDVGTRVMHQSTLVMLAKGYAVSFTVIGATEDEVEELIEGVSFAGAKAKAAGR